MKTKIKSLLLGVLALAATLAATLTTSCRDTWTPNPDPAPQPSPSPNSQGAQVALSIAVPALVPPGPTPGSWVSSSLITVTSLGISAGGTSADRVTLVGTNDPSVALTSSSVALASFTGGQSLQNVGTLGAQIGAFAYFGVLRAAGTTTGLTFILVGDDGTSGGMDGGVSTADQGRPGPLANAWPVKVTDGASVAAVKPASTPSSSTDPALVVSFSPNSPLPVGANTIGIVTQGAPGLLSWPVEVTNGPIGVTAAQGTSPWVTEPSPVVPVVSTSLTSTLLLKASSGTHFSTLIQVDSTAPTGIYYAMLLQGASSCPSSGSVTSLLLHAPIAVYHVNGQPGSVTFNDVGAQASFSTGLCAALSTTQFTLTGAPYLVADGSVL